MTKKVSAKRKNVIFKALPGSRDELSSRLGIRQDCVGVALRQMRAEGKIHIGAWQRNPPYYRATAVFHAGNGIDVELPDFQARYRSLGEKIARAYGTLAPRADPMVWITCGRQPPGMGAR